MLSEGEEEIRENALRDCVLPSFAFKEPSSRAQREREGGGPGEKSPK